MLIDNGKITKEILNQENEQISICNNDCDFMFYKINKIKSSKIE